ncbi:hypothetical protein D9757_004950 [Collybiopsis confluens]|uniref:Uncharacterized protein n=1 Tax=Collybiopsis confluens TaxID=2823264 RepID=A0A8H5HTR2_9AGAR|nr:hypothetical protein D9757_004950 [Collybiopsis confluens]
MILQYCHNKPKYGQFNYCSKTCAAQIPSSKGGGTSGSANALGLNFNLNPNPNGKPTASNTTKPRTGPSNGNLCDYCKKAPKHPGHDFCGKNCAQSAKSGTGGSGGGVGTGSQASSKSAGGQNSTGPATTNSNQKSNPNNPKTPALNALVAQAAQAAVAALAGNANIPALNTIGNTKSVDPTQIASLVMQQLQSFLPAVIPVSSATGAGSTANSSSRSVPRKAAAPGLNLHVQTQSLGPEADADQELGECLIPGCNQPVYFDEVGQKQSAYCSMRHRQ